MAINYKTVGWDTNKYINPTNMNQMDNGIKAACDKADKNESDISALNVDLTNKIALSGINEALLSSHRIGVDLSFDQLIQKQTVTFFTNWDDSTHFPRQYGSGVLIPCWDNRNVLILYISVVEPTNLYIGCKDATNFAWTNHQGTVLK